MADGWFTLDAKDFETLQENMQAFGAGSGKVIDQVLHNEGAEEIKRNILPLIHSSGRTWRGKKAPAASAKPFTQKNGSLSVTILSRGYYHYLYFPDDGSNTVRHAGNQQFMQRGAENSADTIIDRCIGKLIESFE